MNIHIRLETPADHYAVEALTREAFWAFWEKDRVICDEHLLVHRLRSCPSFVPELNTVAELDGRIIGHIIYSKSRIEEDCGQTYETLTFGPLSVLPELQKKGVGTALMRHTLAEAKRLGHRAVLIFGHPEYYPRIGFRRAAEFGITTADGKTFDAFMAYPLYDGALNGVRGRFYLDPVYESLTQEDALAFDKKFPPKAPHILCGE
ncbi:MAG: N-acetyltransferase [Oscillospiraceae bacterium]|nr:N-acetyltransferase [Oscillospiraceae bacterium]